ncbi:MAG: DUF47 domain-containing protein [Armatimonadota bacterium]
MNLVTKEKKFYSLLDEAAAKMVEAAKALLGMLEDYTDAPQKAAEIRRIEHQGDVIVHEISKRLSASYVTPLDREDIHELAVGLDDVIDCIEATSDRMVLYKIESPTPEAVELARLVVEACTEVASGVAELADLSETEKMRNYCVRIHELENQGDELLRQALAKLFEGELSALDVIKWKEIYDMLEAAIDKCRDVADVLETVVVKQT